MYFFENFKIMAIRTDKNTFLTAILIKLTLHNIFIKVKKSPRAAPPSQKINTNLKTLVSPLMTCPQGPKGV